MEDVDHRTSTVRQEDSIRAKGCPDELKARCGTSSSRPLLSPTALDDFGTPTMKSIALPLLLLPRILATSFNVSVGDDNGLGCSPAFIEGVAGGDVVNFIFQPGSNIVVQSASDNACDVLSGGFSTGSVHVPSGTTVRSFPVPAGHHPLQFSCGAPSDCWSRTTLTVNRNTAQAPVRNDAPEPFQVQARADTPSGLTSVDFSTATLGSHNPGTFSGSVATPDPSARDGATGSATTGLHLSTTTRPPSGSSTSPGGASGSNSVSGSSTASASGGNSTSAAETLYVGKSTVILGSFVFGLGVFAV
ncbi:hypothetical protein CVT26_015311 [Gymnopilus dilepis]|uniref:Phytocyanin domain-containing protein n=1 Tax=Gymnopilus dilepis TaxID=231916 RepID=A0A409W478_9AGAR|nr:hypothetical protein CVT26_015311 [Gymnopilus dilepis]